MALPQRFIERLEAIYPAEAQTLLQTFYRPKPISFRINTLKIDIDSAIAQLEASGFSLTPTSWYPYAFSVPYAQRDALVRSSLFAEGKIYIQSLSSMLAPLILDPRPGETILDLAAAPGGKSLMIAQMMENHGWLSVVEPGKDRFFRLKTNLEKGGVTIAHHYLTDGRSVGNKCPAMFDRILLDAPCSSEAKFKDWDEKTTAYWSERKIKEMAKLQYRLLLSAIKSLKPGGLLLYATCSFAPEENEAIIDRAKQKEPSLTLLPISLDLKNQKEGLTQWGKKRFHPTLLHTVRILPDESMDGFYLALLKRGE